MLRGAAIWSERTPGLSFWHKHTDDPRWRFPRREKPAIVDEAEGYDSSDDLAVSFVLRGEDGEEDRVVNLRAPRGAGELAVSVDEVVDEEPVKSRLIVDVSPREQRRLQQQALISKAVEIEPAAAEPEEQESFGSDSSGSFGSDEEEEIDLEGEIVVDSEQAGLQPGKLTPVRSRPEAELRDAVVDGPEIIDGVALEEILVTDMRRLASAMGVTGYTRHRKEQLAARLRKELPNIPRARQAELEKQFNFRF